MHEISIISMIFTIALLLVCLYLSISPLFKLDSFLNGSNRPDQVGSKEALLTTLNELEFEYRMEKISNVDYQNLKKQYESQVAAIMKEEEQVVVRPIDKDLMAEVEKEIEATLKSNKNKKGEGK
jgi:hypothetical protein